MPETIHTYHIEWSDIESAKEVTRITREFFSELNELLQQEDSIPYSLPMLVSSQLRTLLMKAYDDMAKYVDKHAKPGFVSGREVALVINESIRCYADQVEKKIKEHSDSFLNYKSLILCVKK